MLAEGKQMSIATIGETKWLEAGKFQPFGHG